MEKKGVLSVYLGSAAVSSMFLWLDPFSYCYKCHLQVGMQFFRSIPTCLSPTEALPLSEGLGEGLSSGTFNVKGGGRESFPDAL